jgi:hypothetical protein
MLVDYVRIVHAAQKLKLKKDFEFIEFDDIAKETMDENSPIPDHIEIWAAVKVPYEGEIPESYKTLNLIIGDWVNSNQNALTKVLHQRLTDHFKEHYPNSEVGNLSEEVEDTAIWLDQLDYMPRIHEGENYMVIEIELILETEQIGD